MQTETTQRFRFSSDEIKDLIVAHLKAQGVDASKRDIDFQVDGGDPGGYGSMGDPAHVYNSPTPASFGGATVTVRSWGKA